ncbi:MAG: lamin tail domain-containing protein, partial [Abitibacteriaceae bacterium]|nr:lamin tail domain-containing protein [Abditibacteriaceae bacterium]
LPAGISLNPDGTFTGTPTAATTATGVNVTVTVSDRPGSTTAATITVKVQEPFSLVVTTLQDSNDPYDGQTSLREAITNADASADQSDITFASNLTGIIQLGSALPLLNTNLSITGPGANLLTVRRNTGGYYRIFFVAANVTVSLKGLTISNGSSSTGSGVCNFGTLTLTNCAISGNSASNSTGGGIYNYGTFTLMGCTVSGNSADYGGGIYSSNSTGAGASLTVQNSTISGNSGASDGNGLLAGNGLTIIQNSTITNNAADGLAVENVYNPPVAAQVQVSNSIIAGNGGSDINYLSGTIQSNGYNLIGTGTGLNAFNNHDTTGLVAANLKIGPLADNGGPTQTHALLAGSPAISAGDPAYNGTGQYDQRGPGFARVHGGRLDIGAFEFQPPNTAPVATGPTTFSVVAGTSTTLTLTGSDAESDVLTYKITTLPANGTLYDGPSSSGTAITTVPYAVTDANHQVTYLAPATYLGPDSFGFKVNDSTVDSAELTVPGTVVPRRATTGAIISEFRLRGPGGPTDEYVELANTTTGPLNIGGWTLQYPTAVGGTTVVTIPTNTTIPKGGHLLLVGSGYSLGSYATKDLDLPSDIPDGAGVLLNNGRIRQDAVGFAGASTSYRTGNGIVASIVGNGQNAFMRKQNGTPYVNSGDNANDFDFVAVTGGVVDGAAAKLGAPGPKSLSSPLLHNDILSAVALPVFRDTTAVGTNATYGTMSVRYKVTNNGSQTLTRLRFRAVMLPAGGAISGGTWQTNNGTADLRLLTSADTTATINGVSVPVKGSSLEEPPTQSNGGGLNSSMSLDLSGLSGGGLAPGASVNVQFNFGVVVKGTYRAVLNMEGLP